MFPAQSPYSLNTVQLCLHLFLCNSVHSRYRNTKKRRTEKQWEKIIGKISCELVILCIWIKMCANNSIHMIFIFSSLAFNRNRIELFIIMIACETQYSSSSSSFQIQLHERPKIEGEKIGILKNLNEKSIHILWRHVGFRCFLLHTAQFDVLITIKHK